MIDREKVIKGLEGIYRCVSPVTHTCGNCPYQENHVECKRRVLSDALALLKEQNDNIGHWVVLENCSNAGVYCSECHTKIFDRYPMKKKYSYFCPHCGTRMEGQVVKYDA